jgi:DmsE family decaheme c-type cytochrome
MNITKSIFAALLLIAGLAGGVAYAAEEAAKADAQAAPATANPPLRYSEKGADTCLTCHNEGWAVPLYPIFATKHGNRADKRAPFGKGGLQCEACHGPGGSHAEAGGDKTLIMNHGAKSTRPVAQQNAACLTCHRGNSHTGWVGSTHETNNVACANCHKIHVERDPVLAKATQADVCYACHRKERADFHKPSTHPVRFGKVACSECHAPHGSNTRAMLAKQTVNQTCYSCHAEKRGPFLWEHAPVAEDCTLCHTPHGSVYQAMLKKNPPLLCQQCHTTNGHPSVAYTSSGLPGRTSAPSGFLLAGGCTNCHSQVHGSNHPSGVKLMR